MANHAAENLGTHCVDCNDVAPPTQTDYTLISVTHGWRLTRTVTPTGEKIPEWRCPACFAKKRSAR